MIKSNKFKTLIIALCVILASLYFVQGQYNILVYGLEGSRSDVMILVMLDGKGNDVDVISIPRDTYYPVEGKNGLGQAKLNAVYGYAGKEGLVEAISKITGQKITGAVEVKYDGVKSIVDSIGGITVDVPFTMKYDDPYATPPLHINLAKGEQTLTGDDAIGYLRFRKSNDGKIREGDVQRITRQQAFLKSAADEVLPWKLWQVASEATKYVDTDLSVSKIAQISLAMLGTKTADVEFHRLPESKIGSGPDGLSYFFYNAEETQVLMEKIKSNETHIKLEEPADGESTEVSTN